MRIGNLCFYHDRDITPWWEIRSHPQWSYIAVDLGPHRFELSWYKTALGRWQARRQMRKLFGEGWDRQGELR